MPESTGTYLLELTVRTESGDEHSCTVRVRVRPPLEVTCAASAERVPAGERVQLSGDVAHTFGPVETQWRLVAQPEGSSTRIEPADALEATIEPDVAGSYRTELSVTDADGATARCEARIRATGLRAICPEDIETAPLETVGLTGGAGGEPEGEVRFRWQVRERPPGSDASPPMPGTAPEAEFSPDIAGRYRIELVVEDESEREARCETVVRAVSEDELRVEMFWNTNGTDMDLHLLHPEARQWFLDLDCYYFNCDRSPLSWFTPAPDDDPQLDLDDTDGKGPENINIHDPASGVYRVGVHAFEGTATEVTVRVFCGGDTVEPTAVVGPAPLREKDLFWRAADIDIDGDRCEVRPISGDTMGYDIVPKSRTHWSR